MEGKSKKTAAEVKKDKFLSKLFETDPDKWVTPKYTYGIITNEYWYAIQQHIIVVKRTRTPALPIQYSIHVEPENIVVDYNSWRAETLFKKIDKAFRDGIKERQEETLNKIYDML